MPSPCSTGHDGSCFHTEIESSKKDGTRAELKESWLEHNTYDSQFLERNERGFSTVHRGWIDRNTRLVKLFDSIRICRSRELAVLVVFLQDFSRCSPRSTNIVDFGLGVVKSSHELFAVDQDCAVLEIHSEVSSCCELSRVNAAESNRLRTHHCGCCPH